MCLVGTPGFYFAPTDMAAAGDQILSRVGPGTESAAIVTGVSADGRFVNLRVFPDQGEAFHLQGVGFGDDPVLGSFSNLIPHEDEAPIGDTAMKERQQADARLKRKRRAQEPPKKEEPSKGDAPKPMFSPSEDKPERTSDRRRP